MRICQWKNDKDLFTNASWIIKTAKCFNKTRSEFAQSVNTNVKINMSQISSVQSMTVKINMFSLLKTLSSVKTSTGTQQILSSENHSYHFSTSSFWSWINSMTRSVKAVISCFILSQFTLINTSTLSTVSKASVDLIKNLKHQLSDVKWNEMKD